LAVRKSWSGCSARALGFCGVRLLRRLCGRHVRFALARLRVRDADLEQVLQRGEHAVEPNKTQITCLEREA